jgi:hypothetical protein
MDWSHTPRQVQGGQGQQGRGDEDGAQHEDRCALQQSERDDRGGDGSAYEIGGNWESVSFQSCQVQDTRALELTCPASSLPDLSPRFHQQASQREEVIAQHDMYYD